MTPKEKAQKLFDEVNEFILIESSFNDTGKEASLKMIKDHLATKKICTYIVDIILNDVGAKDWEEDEVTKNNYWKEVKKEIDKL